MRSTATMIAVFPTWLLHFVIRPMLKEDHPMKEKMNLKQWSDFSSDLAIEFAATMWCLVLFIIFVYTLPR